MSLGPTGKFPRGKFNAHDEGELRIGVAHKDKTVIIDFGTPTKWIGLDADGALEFATLITSHALQIKDGK